MWVQSIVLEYHRDISVFRRNVVYQFIADEQFALRDFFQAGDHSQGSGFTTAGRTEDRNEFAVFNRQVEIINSRYRPETFKYMFNTYLCQFIPLLL